MGSSPGKFYMYLCLTTPEVFNYFIIIWLHILFVVADVTVFLYVVLQVLSTPTDFFSSRLVSLSLSVLVLLEMVDFWL